MATLFNNPQDIPRAVSILEWTRQYMEMNQAHISKLDRVQASLVLLRRASASLGADLPPEHAALLASTLRNCIHFYDLNAPEPVDSAWVASLPLLQGVRADWF